jgi:hypothetical protein
VPGVSVLSFLLLTCAWCFCLVFSVASVCLLFLSRLFSFYRVSAVAGFPAVETAFLLLMVLLASLALAPTVNLSQVSFRVGLTPVFPEKYCQDWATKQWILNARRLFAWAKFLRKEY